YALGQLGSLTAVKTTDTTGSGTGGLLTAPFTAPDAALNQMANCQTENETYTITLDDQNGGVVTRDVTATIPGADDAPVIGAAQLTGSVTEDLQGHETGSETTSGTIAFTDADLPDLPLFPYTTLFRSYALGQLGSLTAVKTTDTTGSGTG